MLTVPFCVVLQLGAPPTPLDSLRTHALPTHRVPVLPRQRHPDSQPLVSSQGYSAPFEHGWQHHSVHHSAFAGLFLLMSAEFSLASCNQSTVGLDYLPFAPPGPSANGKPNMRQERRTVRLEYLFPCLVPYKVILGDFST